MRYLHTMIRVRDLDAALDFFIKKLGLVEVRRRDSEKGRFTLVFLCTPGNEDADSPQVELTHNWDQDDPYTTGRNFGHLAYEVDDIYALCQSLMDEWPSFGRRISCPSNSSKKAKPNPRRSLGPRCPIRASGNARGLTAVVSTPEHRVVQVKGSKSQTVDGSTDTIDNAAVPVVETPSIVQPPDTAFARSLVEAGGYGQRRRTKQGAPIDRWPMMAYHQTAANPSTRSAQETKKVDVGGQVAWSHDPGHVYGSYHTFDALHFDGWPDRKVHVLLPRGWDDGERNFPVVFMNDGQNAFFESDGGRSWFVADQLASMNGRTRDVIVVGLEALNRAPEYTYIKRPAGVLRVQDYTKYLADHVKPFIDANYPTVSNDATIVGSSHGGLAAFFIATRRPDAFGKAICMSSSFWHGLDKGARGGPLRDSNLITPIVETLSDPKVRPSLWIDWGLVRDGGPHNADIEALATKRGEEMVDLLGATFGYDQGHDLFAFEDPEGRHDETSWGRRFIGAMDAFYGRST